MVRLEFAKSFKLSTGAKRLRGPAPPAIPAPQPSRNRSPVSNRTSLILALIIVGLVLLDLAFFGTEHVIFLGKKLADLIEWVAFWR